jgi:hypothetical protein
VLENRQLLDTEIIKQTIIITKFKNNIFSSTTRRRSVSVLHMINSQNVSNALTVLRYKSFEKRSRERSKQQNADNTTTTSTQNEEL